MSWINRSRTFLKEVMSEMRKVSFPSRQEVISTTAVVIVTSIIFALFLFAADQVIVRIYQVINETFG